MENKTSEKRHSSHAEPHIKLRRRILKRLYELFTEHPYATVELVQIAEECNANAKELNWNIVYLEKCGYVELSKSYASQTYIASSATITAEGIDLVEDENEFNRRFPDANEEKLVV